MAQTDFDYFVIWVRGVPWQQNENDLSTWFESKGVNTYDGCYGVYFVYNRNGVFRGDCYVLLNSDDDMQRSLQLDKQQFGERYLEIRQSTWGDLEGALAEFRRGPDESVMKIRGLPYSAREEDLRNYFEGYNLVDVIMCLNDTGRASGDAFVRFGSKADVKRAFEKHKQKLGERYVELFLASEGLIDLYNERGFIVTGGGYSSEGGGGGGFRERGGYSGGGGDDYRDSGRGGGGRGDRRGGRGGFRGDRGGGGGGGFRGGDRGGGRNGYDRNGGGGDRFDRGGGGFDRRGRGGGGGYGGDRSGGGGGGGGCSSQRYDPYSAPQYGGGHGGSARRGGGGTSLFIRGLPFNVSEREIETFFEPIPVSSVTLNASDRGSSSDGTAWAEFNSRSDAEQAMQRDRGKIQHRYVELFWHDPTKKRRTPDSGGGGGGIGGGGGYGMADSGGAPPPPPMTMQYAAAPPPQYQMGAPPMIPYGQAGYVMPMMATGVPQAAPQYDYGNAGGSYGGGMPPPHQPGAGW